MGIVGVLFCWRVLSAEPAAAQWVHSLATIASLRTGHAALTSSNAIKLSGDRLALITYWELRTAHDLDVYRCIDVVDNAFNAVRETCWSALRPSGRVPAVLKNVPGRNGIRAPASSPPASDASVDR
jgi:hypothetical protein